jgi:hypothetical protein
MARAGLFWFIIEASVWFADFLASRVRDGLPILSMSPGLQWALFGVHVILMVSIAAYLRAKLAFYLPSAAFQQSPGSLANTWRQTRGLMPHLFIAFLIVEIAAAVAQLGLIFLLSRVQAGIGVAESAAWLLGTRSNFMLYALPPAAIIVVIGVPQTLIDAALSAVAFRTVTPPEMRAMAEVFS